MRTVRLHMVVPAVDQPEQDTRPVTSGAVCDHNTACNGLSVFFCTGCNLHLCGDHSVVLADVFGVWCHPCATVEAAAADDLIGGLAAVWADRTGAAG